MSRVVKEAPAKRKRSHLLVGVIWLAIGLSLLPIFFTIECHYSHNSSFQPISLLEKVFGFGYCIPCTNLGMPLLNPVLYIVGLISLIFSFQYFMKYIQRRG